MNLYTIRIENPATGDVLVLDSIDTTRTRNYRYTSTAVEEGENDISNIALTVSGIFTLMPFFAGMVHIYNIATETHVATVINRTYSVMYKKDPELETALRNNQMAALIFGEAELLAKKMHKKKKKKKKKKETTCPTTST